MLENINDLDKFEKDLIERKKTSSNKKESTKKSPFAKKGNIDFKFGNLKGANFGNIDFKKEILSKIDLMVFLWVILIIFSIYSYNTNTFNKIEENPTLNKNISILKGNIKKQEDEIQSLEKINLDNDTLSAKELILDKNLMEDNELLSLEQSNDIYKIAQEVGLDIESLQKIEIRRDDKKIEELGYTLEDKGIENFYNKAWYTKFILTTISSEEVILRFKEKIEDRVEFIFDGFGINQSDGEIKYSFSLKAFYNLKNEQNEQNN